MLGLVLMVFESFGDDPRTVMAPIELDEDERAERSSPAEVTAP